MATTTSMSLPVIYIPLAATPDDHSQGTTLSNHDLKKLGSVKKIVLAFEALLPKDLLPTRKLVGHYLCIHVSASDTSPANLGTSEVCDISIAILAAVEKSATDVKRFAETTVAHQMKEMVPNKKIATFISALADANADAGHPVKLVIDEAQYPFPVIPHDVLTSGTAKGEATKHGQFRVVSIERGDHAGGHKFGLAGGAKVRIPNTERLLWIHIRHSLDHDCWLDGVLRRPSGQGDWAIDEGAVLISQPDLFSPTGE